MFLRRAIYLFVFMFVFVAELSAAGPWCWKTLRYVDDDGAKDVFSAEYSKWEWNPDEWYVDDWGYDIYYNQDKTALIALGRGSDAGSLDNISKQYKSIRNHRKCYDCNYIVPVNIILPNTISTSANFISFPSFTAGELHGSGTYASDDYMSWMEGGILCGGSGTSCETGSIYTKPPVPKFYGCDISLINQDTTELMVRDENTDMSDCDKKYQDVNQDNPQELSLRIRLAEAWRRGHLDHQSTSSYMPQYGVTQDVNYVDYCGDQGKTGVLTLSSLDESEFDLAKDLPRIRSNVQLRHLTVRVNIKHDVEGYEADGGSAVLNTGIILPLENMRESNFYPGLVGTGTKFDIWNSTIISRGSKILIERTWDDWKNSIMGGNLVAIGNKYGLYIPDAPEDADMNSILRKFSYYKAEGFEDIHPFIVTPVKLGKDTPNYTTFIPRRTKKCFDGKDECEDKDKVNITQGFINNKSVKSLYRITYGKYCIGGCSPQVNSEIGQVISKGEGANIPSGFSSISLPFIDKIDVSGVSEAIITNRGSRLVPISEIKGNLINIDCYMAHPQTVEISDQFKKINSVCHFNNSAEQNPKFDVLIANTSDDTLKYEATHIPIWGQEINENGKRVFPVELNYIGLDQNLIKNYSDYVKSGQSDSPFSFYGLVVGENGLENYYYKINFKLADQVADRSIDIYPNKEFRGTNLFEVGKNYVFYKNVLFGHVENNKFVCSDEASCGNNIVKKTWSEMKMMYDQLGRVVVFKVVRDMRGVDSRDAVITVGYIKDNVVELLDPYIPEDNACNGGIYCTMVNFLNGEFYRNTDPKPTIEPLSKMMCKKDESIDYLCLASNPTDWGFNDYNDNCDKVNEFRKGIVAKIIGPRVYFYGPPAILDLPLYTEKKYPHLYHWCMPLYDKEGKSEKVERFYCETDPGVKIDDSSFTCSICKENTVPDKTKSKCEECEEGLVAYNGKCVKSEEIPDPEEPGSECLGAGPFRLSNSCSCKSGSQRMENSDRSRFMCVECEAGFVPDEANFGKCIKIEAVDLGQRKKDCEASGVSRWNQETNTCELNLASSINCPTNGEFLSVGKYKDCKCKDGSEPVVNTATNMAECGRSGDTSENVSPSSNGCNLGDYKNNYSLALSWILLILAVLKIRKHGASRFLN